MMETVLQRRARDQSRLPAGPQRRYPVYRYLAGPAPSRNREELEGEASEPYGEDEGLEILFFSTRLMESEWRELLAAADLRVLPKS